MSTFLTLENSMECTLAAVSDFAYVDRSTAKSYILGVVRYIFAQTVPAVHERLAVTFQLEESTRLTTQPIRARILIHNQDGQDVTPPSPFIDLPFERIGPASIGMSQCQVCLELVALQLPTFGDYAVILASEHGAELARARFTVQPFPPELGRAG